jgi:hypothetical protein
MQSPAGRDLWGKFDDHEIVAPERLVFVVSLSDQEGNPVRHLLNPTWPRALTGQQGESGSSTGMELSPHATCHVISDGWVRHDDG